MAQTASEKGDSEDGVQGSTGAPLGPRAGRRTHRTMIIAILALSAARSAADPSPTHLRVPSNITQHREAPPRLRVMQQQEVLSNGGHVLLEPLLAPALRGADVTPTHGGFGDPGLEDELERWCEDRLREIEVEERNGASTRAMSKAASAPVNWKAGRLGGGKAQLGIQAQQEEVVEEEEEGLPLVKGLVLSAWRAYGRVKQAGLVKELYLHFKGREHPYPFCAWQVEFDPRVLTPVLLDTHSVYRLQALHFTSTDDVFRITGTFPRVRYFSFQSYDARGQPLSTLPDFLVRASVGHNPFSSLPPHTPPGPPGNEGRFQIYITADGRHGYPNELAGLRDPSLCHTTTLIYRLYDRDPLVGPLDTGCDWGYVEPPVVEKRVRGVRGAQWEALPLCEKERVDALAQAFVQFDHQVLAPAPPDPSVCGLYDKAGQDLQVVNATFPFGHLESPSVRAYVVYTNKDSNYLYWCDAASRLLSPSPPPPHHKALRSRPHLGHATQEAQPHAEAVQDNAFVLVLKGRLPTTPTGLYDGTRIATPLAYEARYVSISSVENMAPSNTYQSISDTQLQAHYAPLAPHPWDRRYTIVAAVDQHTAERCGGLLGPTDVFLPFARPGMGPPRLPGLVYREILSRYRVTGEPDASAAYLQSVCDADNAECSGDEPWRLEALSRSVMHETYPVISVYRCDLSTGQVTPLT